MRILYLGDAGGAATSVHRRQALQRLGHEVRHIGTHEFVLGRGRVLSKLHYLTGHQFRQQNAAAKISALTRGEAWDLAWVDSGWWCGPAVVDAIGARAGAICLFNLDDPTGPREPWHWRMLRAAIPRFDLCVTPREETANDFRNGGAKNVLRVWRSYDEVAHAPCADLRLQRHDLKSHVAFIGSRMEDRAAFLYGLVQRGVPLSIWGNGWARGAFAKEIQECWRGPALAGRDYVTAIQNSKLCLGLLSRLNRDRHTTRSAEVPYAGGLLCAQRTDEHAEMYVEGRDAVFWSDVDECAQICLELLEDDEKRDSIRRCGAARVRDLGLGNEAVCSQVLAHMQSLGLCV